MAGDQPLDTGWHAAVKQRRTALLFVLMGIVACGSVIAALAFGSVPTPLPDVLAALFFASPDTTGEIIRALRVPRALAAFACGGLLALAGTLLQVLLRNALADPYVLGISGGASLGALLALAAGASAAAMNTSALAGALAAIALVFGLTYRSGDWNVYRLLLTGIVLSAGLSALISLTLVLAPEAQVKGMLFWLMGDLSQTESGVSAALVLCALLVISIAAAVQLDLLALGDLKARALGVSVGPLQLMTFLAAAIATVAAVVTAGAIGFIGLLAPHAIRLAGVAHHRALLPLSVLLGASLLTLADTMARTVWAPQQLPVGIFTALIGVPAMLLLLGRQR